MSKVYLKNKVRSSAMKCRTVDGETCHYKHGMWCNANYPTSECEEKLTIPIRVFPKRVKIVKDKNSNATNCLKCCFNGDSKNCDKMMKKYNECKKIHFELINE